MAVQNLEKNGKLLDHDEMAQFRQVKMTYIVSINP